MEGRQHVAAWSWALIAVEILIALNAVYGGIGLMWTGLGLPSEWLAGTGFGSWVLPGLFLLLVVAVPMSVAAVLEIRRSPWAYAASLTAGVVQMGWIVVQVAWLRRYFFLQPVLFALGLLIIGLAWWTHRGEPLVPARTPAPR